jgi:hypothetical protein
LVNPEYLRFLFSHLPGNDPRREQVEPANLANTVAGIIDPDGRWISPENIQSVFDSNPNALQWVHNVKHRPGNDPQREETKYRPGLSIDNPCKTEAAPTAKRGRPPKAKDDGSSGEVKKAKRSTPKQSDAVDGELSDKSVSLAVGGADDHNDDSE